MIAHQLADQRMTLRAVVVLRQGCAGDAMKTRELKDYVRTVLMPFKYPRLLEYVTELPKTGTGKIDRQALGAAPDQQTD